MGFILFMSLFLLNADFPICTADDEQQYPSAVFLNDQYCVFWIDNRYHYVDSIHTIFGARVDTDGTVIDPDGKLLFSGEPGFATAAAFDGTNFLVVFRDSC